MAKHRKGLPTEILKTVRRRRLEWAKVRESARLAVGRACGRHGYGARPETSRERVAQGRLDPIHRVDSSAGFGIRAAIAAGLFGSGPCRAQGGRSIMSSS